MNPNDLFLRSHAHAQQQAAAAAAAASSAAPPASSSTASLPPPGSDLAHHAQRQYRARKDAEQERKDAELANLLDLMDDYKPIIPDEVTDYYLQRAGFDTSDVHVKRLLALAAQRFVSSIASDAFQYARARTAAGPGSARAAGQQDKGGAAQGAAQGGAQGQAKAKGRQRTVLTMEDLSSALKEYGVDASRAPYYL